MIAHSAANGLGHYLVSFIAYTLLAVGAIYAAFFFLKQNPRLLAFLARRPQPGQNQKTPLSVETMLPLETRKALYIIRSGEERFLIATSAEGTQFLSKLAEEPQEKFQEERQPECLASAGPKALLSESIVVSEEAIIPMQRVVPMAFNLKVLKTVQQTLALVLSKVLPIFRERFEKLQYQFEKTSSSHW